MVPDRSDDPTPALAAVRRWWLDLERGWQATIVGTLVVAVATLL